MVITTIDLFFIIYYVLLDIMLIRTIYSLLISVIFILVLKVVFLIQYPILWMSEIIVVYVYILILRSAGLGPS